MVKSIFRPLGVMGTTPQGSTPFDELQNLQGFGPAGVDLLRSLMAEELRRYPALLNGMPDRREFALELTIEFFTEKAQRLVESLVAAAADDDCVARYCRISVRHWLADRSRGGPTGHIHRKVMKLLREYNGKFEQVPTGEEGGGWWRIAGSPAAPGRSDIDGLARAAAAFVTKAVPVDRGGIRRPPVASSGDLVAILQAVLRAAGGSLPSSVLTDVLARRFPLWVAPAETSLETDPVDHAQAFSIAAVPAGVDSAEVEAQARIAFDQLTPAERALVRFVGPGNMDIKMAQTALGCGRSAAFERVNKTTQRLRVLLLPLGDDAEQVSLRLRELCLDAETPDSTVSGTSDHGDSTDIRIVEGA
jgi:hypothetical protein